MSHDPPLETFSSNLIKSLCDNSLSPRSELGQNFLVDWDVPRDEVRYADVSAEDTVLEIGPGLGSLTCFLAATAGETIAIEKDDRLAPMLSNLDRSYDSLTIYYEDALDFDLRTLRFDKVVSNLPYGVALPLLFEILETNFETAVLLVQSDLADRVTKSPGDDGYNRLSVQFYRRANVDPVRTVDADSFYPVPDVDGTIVKITDVEPKFDVPSEEYFKTTLMYLFSQRERTVGEALDELTSVGSGARLSTTALSNVRERAGDVSTKRIETVTSREFGEVTRALDAVTGDDALAAFDAYFDEHDLYRRARN